MNAQQFQAALDQLGLSDKWEAAVFLGYRYRHINRLISGECPVPPYIGKLLAVMVAGNLTPAQVDAAMSAFCHNAD